MIYYSLISCFRRIFMTKTNAPTMKDVAKEAGVSLGTVSKVINGITVREEYKKKVEAAIASLHYEIIPMHED